ncbi:MAG: type II toxin-antitoxin system RelE/ParE family toxin [bacterium]|nr:type II toxin-antitoxin system RelE/ParE family toxin [bacterium]
MPYAHEWNVVVDRSVDRKLGTFPRKDAERILAVLAEFSVNPYAGDTQKMKGKRSVWRRRIGSYRILYEIFTTERVVFVSCIARRTSSTYS